MFALTEVQKLLYTVGASKSLTVRTEEDFVSAGKKTDAGKRQM